MPALKLHITPERMRGCCQRKQGVMSERVGGVGSQRAEPGLDGSRGGGRELGEGRCPCSVSGSRRCRSAFRDLTGFLAHSSVGQSDREALTGLQSRSPFGRLCCLGFSSF